MAPAWTAPWTALWPGSKRRTKPSWIGAVDPANDFRAAVHPLEAEIDRFLAEHWLSGRHRLFQEIGVRVGRRCNQNGVHVPRREDLGRRSHHLSARRSGDGLGRRTVDVLNRREAGARVSGDIGGVHGADAAAAEHSDPDHRGPPSGCLASCLQFLLHIVANVNIPCA